MKECKKRKDSYWGIHCDFHAKPEMGVMGRTLCEEDIRKVCRQLRPDFWQIDCKGHFGWVSYPTKLGNAMPEFAVDTLEMWRRVTREEGVALYLHYSGIWEEKYCDEHPEERMIGPDGCTPYEAKVVRCNGHYADDLLIPQIAEAWENYQIDGVWLDGECWACHLDYHPDTLAAFEREKGICLNGQRPVKGGDPYFEEFKEYNRELFRRHVQHYTEVLHERCPGLQIASNWMYSDHMPEPVTVGVDYLSGDASPNDSFHSVRLASRTVAQQGMPWDIMGVAQCFGVCNLDLLPKHPTQMIQLAAATISLGGGFQAGLSFLFDGSPNMPNLLNLQPVADFMREREEWCFKVKPIPQAAMFFSCYDQYKEEKVLLGGGDKTGKMGLTSLLCDTGQSLEIVSEHTLLEKGYLCDMIAVPETQVDLKEETVQQLLAYAENGGSLLLTGTNTCRIFAEAGAPFEVLPIEDELVKFRFLAQVNDTNDQRYWTMDGKSIGAVLFPMEIQAQGEHEVVAHTCYTVKSPWHPFAVIAKYGKGRIAAVGADIGKAFKTGAQYLHRDLIRKLCEKLYEPIVHIESVCGTLEIVCTEKNGRMLVQLINGNGDHSNARVDTESFIPPVLDIELSIACETEPEKLILQPEGRELAFTCHNGRAFVKIDRLAMHGVIEIV